MCLNIINMQQEMFLNTETCVSPRMIPTLIKTQIFLVWGARIFKSFLTFLDFRNI